MAQKYPQYDVILCVIALLCCITGVICVMLRVRAGELLTGHFLVSSCMLFIAVFGSLSYSYVNSSDAVYGVLKSGQDTPVIFKVMNPIMASDRRGFDCKTDVELQAIQNQYNVVVPSHHVVRYYSSRKGCEFKRGGTYFTVLKLSNAQYGSMDIWADTAGSNIPKMIQPPARIDYAVDYVQQSFLSLNLHYSKQSQVLTPGLTLGVMGQDTFHNSSASEDKGTGVELSDAYAKHIKQVFLVLGIMHLMAVSGSHFVLAAQLARKIWSILLRKRLLLIGLTGLFYVIFAVVMFPSQSIVRALVMGIIVLFYYSRGRPSCSIANLNWTVLFVLIIQPNFAVSYGFALSCTAVYGILLFYKPVYLWLSQALPKILAQEVSLTACAQVLSLPISILLTPNLPIYSIPANIAMAPLVAIATICGLCALVCAWCLPQVAQIFMTGADLITQVMERIATIMYHSAYSAVAWPQGERGIICLCGLYTGFIGAYYAFRVVKRVLKTQSKRAQHTINRNEIREGDKFKISGMKIVRVWCKETLQIVFTSHW